MENYKDLLELSQKEKRGLTFFVKGQTISGIVTEIIENQAVVARSQMYSKIIIKIDSIDAVAVT